MREVEAHFSPAGPVDSNPSAHHFEGHVIFGLLCGPKLLKALRRDLGTQLGGALISPKGVLSVIPEMRLPTARPYVPFFIIIFPIPVIVIVQGSQIVEPLWGSWPK